MIIYINGIDITDKVTKADLQEKCRSESVEYTLSGNALIDRIGGFKQALNISLGLVEYNVYKEISDILKQISFKVTIIIENETKEYIMHLADKLPVPTPVKISGREYLTDINLTFEEV